LKIIFAAGFNEFAVEAFAISSVDYMVKPVEKNRVYKALERAKAVILNDWEAADLSGNKRLAVRSNSSLYYIAFNDIIFIEKSGKKCIIYTVNQTVETYENISDIFMQLDSNFYRTHRSYIVNLRMLSHIRLRTKPILPTLSTTKNMHIFLNSKLMKVRKCLPK
jgi:two-component system LytT family response regulator